MSPAATLVVVVVTAVVVHELAHVVASRAVGHDIFEIRIGTGPTWTTRIRSVDVGLGLLPLGGHVQTGSRSGDGFRWRSAVVAASGVTANLVLAGLGVAIGNEVVVGFNSVAVAANLWPGGRRRLGDGSSDGRVLLDVLRDDRDAIAEERSGWYCVQAMRAREDGDVGTAVAIVEEGRATAGDTRALLAVAGVLAFEQGRFADVVDAYALLIDDDRVTVSGRAGFAADAAWAASLSGDPALERLALPWAEFAHRVRPRVPRRRVVLALAEVDAGRPADALRTLGRLDDPSADAIRVIALAATGAVDDAAARFASHVEVRLDAGHPLARRARAAVEASTR